MLHFGAPQYINATEVRAQVDLKSLLTVSADPETQNEEPEMTWMTRRRNIPDRNIRIVAKSPHLEAVVL